MTHVVGVHLLAICPVAYYPRNSVQVPQSEEGYISGLVPWKGRGLHCLVQVPPDATSHCTCGPLTYSKVEPTSRQNTPIMFQFGQASKSETLSPELRKDTCYLGLRESQKHKTLPNSTRLAAQSYFSSKVDSVSCTEDS